MLSKFSTWVCPLIKIWLPLLHSQAPHWLILTVREPSKHCPSLSMRLISRLGLELSCCHSCSDAPSTVYVWGRGWPPQLLSLQEFSFQVTFHLWFSLLNGKCNEKEEIVTWQHVSRSQLEKWRYSGACRVWGACHHPVWQNKFFTDYTKQFKRKIRSHIQNHVGKSLVRVWLLYSMDWQGIRFRGSALSKRDLTLKRQQLAQHPSSRHGLSHMKVQWPKACPHGTPSFRSLCGLLDWHCTSINTRYRMG